LTAKCWDNALIGSLLLVCYQYPPTNPSAPNSNHLQEFLAQTSKKLFMQLQTVQLACTAISNEAVIHQVNKNASDTVSFLSCQMQDLMSRASRSDGAQKGPEEKRLAEELSAMPDMVARVEKVTDAEIKDARGEIYDAYVRCGLRQVVHAHFKVPRKLEVQPQDTCALCA
jgi:hypothetical protein